MPGALKRRYEVTDGFIDLTGSSDAEPEPQRKNARLAVQASSSSSRGASNSSSSAAPSSSWSRGVPHSSASSQPSWTPLEDEGDQNQIIDLTAENGVEGDGFIPYGRIDGKIVGIRYYTGEATQGESVMLKREPQNQVGDLKNDMKTA